MTTTKGGIVLLDSKPLTALIKTIEANLPGWWWSISQKADLLTITVGPSEYALLDVDRAMSTLKKYEEFIFTHAGAVVDADKVFIDNKTILIDPVREEMITDKVAFPAFKGAARQQSRDDRHAFRKCYGQLLRELPEIEASGLTLREIYVGSCQLSVDVSLRGTDDTGREFDISHDYLEDAILADSLEGAMKEIKGLVKETV